MNGLGFGLGIILSLGAYVTCYHHPFANPTCCTIFHVNIPQTTHLLETTEHEVKQLLFIRMKQLSWGFVSSAYNS